MMSDTRVRDKIFSCQTLIFEKDACQNKYFAISKLHVNIIMLHVDVIELAFRGRNGPLLRTYLLIVFVYIVPSAGTILLGPSDSAKLEYILL